jgi:arsenite-transporting ATPase
LNVSDSSLSPSPAEAASVATNVKNTMIAAGAARIRPSAAGPRRVFFSGKGGVGKTTAACATAVWAADAGYRTLLVTTDPAAHIGAVLEADVGDTPAPVPGVARLDAVKVDAKHVTQQYKDEVLADARARFDAATVAQIAEELDSPCTEEVAVFQRFLAYLLSDTYEVMVFDTAPTGHTLRLLALPLDYRDQLSVKAHVSEESASVDAAELARMSAALDVVRNPELTTMALVLYPETTPIAEAQRAAADLAGLGIATELIVANQVLPEKVCVNPFFRNRRMMQLTHLERLPVVFPGVDVSLLPLQPEDVRGLPVLRAVGAQLYGAPKPAPTPASK